MTEEVMKPPLTKSEIMQYVAIDLVFGAVASIVIALQWDFASRFVGTFLMFLAIFLAVFTAALALKHDRQESMKLPEKI